MSSDDTSPSKIRWLARKIEDDIRTRGLRAGEPYLTTAQAGRQMGISKSMAYRAMKILDRTPGVGQPSRAAAPSSGPRPPARRSRRPSASTSS